MATQFSITVSNVDNVIKDIKRRNDIAVMRTLNILTRRALRGVAKQISKEYTIKQSSIIKATKVTKATRQSKRVGWFTRGVRLNWIRPKKLSRGVSHIGLDRKRKRVRDPIRGGSRPFTIPAIKGGSGGEKVTDARGRGKDVAVFRQGPGRKVTTLKGHSIPHMMRRISIHEEFLDAYIEEHFAAEYNKQLKRAGFRGRFG